MNSALFPVSEEQRGYVGVVGVVGQVRVAGVVGVVKVVGGEVVE